MGIFAENLAMALRRSPYRLIRRLSCELAQAGITVNNSELEAHYLCGGRIEQLAEFLIRARQHGLPVDFSHACAIDLVAKSENLPCLERLERCLPERSLSIGTLSDGKTKIQGATQAGERLEATISFRYHIPLVAIAYDAILPHLLDQLATTLSAKINSAPSIAALRASKDQIQAELRALAAPHMDRLSPLDIEFRPTPSP